MNPQKLVAVVFLAITSVASGLASPPANAGPNVWTPIGPEAASVTALAVRPDIPRIVFAGTEGNGLLRSTNRAATWSQVNGGLPVGATVRSVVIAPSAPSTVYTLLVNHEFWRSLDGGGSWELVSSLGPLGGAYLLAVDAANPNRLYAAGFTQSLKSSDGGATWVSSQGGLPARPASALFADPRQGNVAYQLFREVGVFKTVNGGQSWFAINSGLPPLSGDLPATALTLDPANPRTLFLATSPRRLFRSTDGGARWRAMGPAVPGLIERLWVLPGSPSVLFALTPRSVERSPDGGASFAVVGIELPRGPITAFAGHPTGGPTLFVGYSLSGVFRSLDAGLSFEPATRGLPLQRTVSLAAEPGVEGSLVAGVGQPPFGGSELLWRRSEGGPWVSASGGLRRQTLTSFQAIVFDPHDPQTLFTGLVTGTARSQDRGVRWQAFSGSTGCTVPTALVAAGTEPTSLFVSGYFPITGCNFQPNLCYAYRSLDRGETWQCLRSPLGDALDFTSFAIDPSSPTTLYAGLTGVSRSLDSGATWETVAAGLSGGDVLFLSVDPSDPDRLYAATPAGVFRRADGAPSWQPIGGWPAGRPAGLTIDRDQPERLYVTVAQQGVFVSEDRGVTWGALNTGLEVADVYGSVVLDGARSEVIYIQTSRGVWSYERLP